MKRTIATAALSAVGMLALAGTASADIGDIDDLTIDGSLDGTAETAEVSGTIRCTTNIEYGLVTGVAQNIFTEGSSEFGEAAEGAFFAGSPNDNADAEGVGAFGPNQGNEANSPCSTSTQDYEVVVQRNRDSDTFEDGSIYASVVAGTSANDGDRGPGPFIGDVMADDSNSDFDRTDP